MAAKPVRLEIKLNEIFGQEVPNDSGLREDIAQEAIDLIVKRTQAGKDVEGKPFTPIPEDSAYAKYKKGITGNSKANLTLFGDMLGDISILEDSSESITLGFPDELQNAKAYNHNTGDTLPKREFFGLTDNDKKKIAKKFAKEVSNPTILSASQLVKENKLLGALRLLNQLNDEKTVERLLNTALEKRGRRG